MADLNKLAEEIVGLTLLEAQELKGILKDQYGIEPAAAATVVAAGGPAVDGGTTSDVEEQTEFSVIMQETGGQKVQVIREIRALTGLGLKEAKAAAEGIGKPIKEGVSKEEADEMKSKLEAAGAKVEIK